MLETKMKLQLTRLIAVLMLVVALPLSVHGQTTDKLKKIAILELAGDARIQPRLDSFYQSLKKLGYVEGRDITFIKRSAEGDADRLPQLAAEIVQLKPDVIFAANGLPAKAVKSVTNSIPIVVALFDPVAAGMASSLAKPGGNVTGVSDFQTEIDSKRVQIFHEILPKMKRIGLLVDTRVPSGKNSVEAVQIASQSLRLEVVLLEVRQRDDFKKSFLLAHDQQLDGLIEAPVNTNLTNKDLIRELATQYKLPTSCMSEEALDGCLFSYGLDPTHEYARAGVYVDRILKGAKPADLPIEQPSEIKLTVNLKNAGLLGIQIPDSIRIAADELVEH